MRTPSCLSKQALLLAASIAVFWLPTSQAAPLSEHPFFKHFIGKWSAEGELKGENNNTITVKEDWTGRSEGDSTLVLEGMRTMNGDTQPFKWTITHNASTDTFEAVLIGNDASQPLRFEAAVSDVNLTIEMKAITGQNSAIQVNEKFADETFNTLVSDVAFTNDQGQKTLEGTITHKRAAGP